MVSTDLLQLSMLAESDIPACTALSAEAGWNQAPEDWALFMCHGTVFGLRTADGRLVATGAVLPYSGKFAWISMVLVTASRRRQRIGTRILETCCAELARRGLVAVLDATPAGERVYRPLGFEALFKLSRWQGNGSGGRSEAPIGIRPMRDEDIAAVGAIDAVAFGAGRSFLLASFYRRAPQQAFVTESLDGFVLARPGRTATQIGPMVAPDEDAAAALLGTALNVAAGPVFFDLCDRCNALVRRVGQRGFTVQRPFMRMAQSHINSLGDVQRTFVVAGPEFG